MQKKLKKLLPKFWCEKGIDGFRMDVISMISKDQRFPDGEMNNGLYGDFGPYSVHVPRVHEFLQEMNHEVLSKYDIMTVGETAGVTIEEAQKYAGEDRNEENPESVLSYQSEFPYALHSYLRKVHHPDRSQS